MPPLPLQSIFFYSRLEGKDDLCLQIYFSFWAFCKSLGLLMNDQAMDNYIVPFFPFLLLLLFLDQRDSLQALAFRYLSWIGCYVGNGRGKNCIVTLVQMKHTSYPQSSCFLRKLANILCYKWCSYDDEYCTSIVATLLWVMLSAKAPLPFR